MWKNNGEMTMLAQGDGKPGAADTHRAAVDRILARAGVDCRLLPAGEEPEGLILVDETHIQIADLVLAKRKKDVEEEEELDDEEEDDEEDDLEDEEEDEDEDFDDEEDEDEFEEEFEDDELDDDDDDIFYDDDDDE